MSRSRSTLARCTAAVMISVAVLQFGPAKGAPADVFITPAPALTAELEKAAELRDGDVSVASQTGALQYGYPIATPPGRQGMAPRLALSYSSQGATYGGIAVGWSLSIPEIREDTSQGRLRTHQSS